MKRALLILAGICSLMQASRAFALTNEEYQVAIRNYRNHIIGVRTGRLLEERFRYASKCKSHQADKLVEQFKHLNKIPLNEQDTVELGDLYLKSHTQVDGECKSHLDDGENRIHNWERRYFLAPEAMALTICARPDFLDQACIAQVTSLLADIDPFCPGLEGPTLDGVRHKTSCYGADRLEASIAHQGDVDQRLLVLFNEKFYEAINNENQKADSKAKSIDIWEIYKNLISDSVAERERFLAILSMYYSMGSSRYAEVDGVKNYYWQERLFSSSSSQEALEAYHGISARRDQFRGLLKVAEESGIEVKLGPRSMKILRDHDYTSSFLGCHYKDSGKATWKYLPIALGGAYKSIDFFFNLNMVTTPSELYHRWTDKTYRDKIEKYLKVDLNNWKDGIDRYKAGVQWGYDFCSGKMAEKVN